MFWVLEIHSRKGEKLLGLRELAINRQGSE